MQALLDFEEYGYLVIEAPRGSGKTVLLREIVRRNIGKEKIGVICSSLLMFKTCYEREFNGKITQAVYIPYKEFFKNPSIDSKFTLLIGDEVFIEPRRNVKTACALSRGYFVHRWDLRDIPFMNESRIDILRSALSKEMFRTMTGLSI